MHQLVYDLNKKNEIISQAQGDIDVEKQDAEAKEIQILIDKAKKELSLFDENKQKLQTMVDILIEKETIYQDEVDMILQGKSKQEILEAIAQKAEPDQTTKEKAEKINVEELIQRAEAQEQELNQKEETNNTDAQEKQKRKYTKKSDNTDKE